MADRNNIFALPADFAAMLAAAQPVGSNPVNSYSADGVANILRFGDGDLARLWDANRGPDGRFTQGPMAQIERDLDANAYPTAFGGSDEVLDGKYNVAPLNGAKGADVHPVGAIEVCMREQLGDANVITLLGVANVLMKEQHEQFVRLRDGTDLTHKNFWEDLQKYGENGLSEYGIYATGKHYWRRDKNKGTPLTDHTAYFANDASKLAEFYNAHTSREFCYLTKQGCLSRLNVLGACLNDQRTQQLPNEDFRGKANILYDTDVLGVSLKKNSYYLNQFGCHLNVGDQVVVELTRHFDVETKEYTYFKLVPRAFNGEFYPSSFYYFDDCGNQQQSHFWYLGRVVTPPAERVHTAQLEYANCLSYRKDPRLAYETLLTLPRVRIATY